MSDPASSYTLLLVLERLRRTRGPVLSKTAVRELLALQVLTLHEWPSPSGRRRLVLLDGPGTLPERPVLVRVRQLVAQAASEQWDRWQVRDVTVVATHLANQRGLRQELVALALAELETAGLVVRRERRVLGLARRAVHVRTPAGDALLADARARRDGGDGSYAGGSSDGGPSFDQCFDAGSSGGGGDGGGDGGGGGGD